jgi:hypothetical protein
MVKSIDFSPFPELNIARLRESAYPTSYTSGSDITMTLRLDDVGVTMRWLNEWVQDVIKPDPDYFGNYIYSDNIEQGKRTGILLIEPAQGGYPFFPRINLHGLMIKSVSKIELDSSEGDPIDVDITLSADDVRIPLLF